jgi:hypothetical protein
MLLRLLLCCSLLLLLQSRRRRLSKLLRCGTVRCQLLLAFLQDWGHE